MINTLVTILDNAAGRVEVNTASMFEIAEAVREETGRVIKYTQAIYYYETEAGYERKRKLKNTYLISIEK